MTQKKSTCNCGLILLLANRSQPDTSLRQSCKRFFSEERKKQIVKNISVTFFFLLRLALVSKFLAFPNLSALHQVHLCYFACLFKKLNQGFLCSV